MKRLIILMVLIRFLTNMSAFIIEDDELFGQIFTFGVLVLEIYLLFGIKPQYKGDDLCQTFIDFSLGAAFYAMIKLLFLDPYEINLWEYFSCIAGFIYIGGKYGLVKLFKRHN